ncbi:hypothetical protein [Nostoc sp. TCL240-02]|uniref:hypothetical protein n=1 Tax=Nostoc sp. TCL240-02 TaxID=2572090 RepID=UPI00157F833A|nr:hypothetical protein [Nostoc sp. TCL240-02]QKQ75672.1 hypothetical protein FBB35_22360 [Nostoc sp. TCL240-02]
MTRSTHPRLQEIYQHYAESYREPSGCTQNAILYYKKSLADDIGKLINCPNHPPLFFPLDRLEKAWLILSGNDDVEVSKLEVDCVQTNH